MKKSKTPKIFCPLKIEDLNPLDDRNYYCSSCNHIVFDLRNGIPEEAQSLMDQGNSLCGITNGEFKKIHQLKTAFFSLSFMLLSATAFAQTEEELPDSLLPKTLPIIENENMLLGVYVGTNSEPIGGYENFNKKLSKNLTIPDSLLTYKSGKAYIQFEVDTMGNIGDFKVLKSYTSEVDQLLIQAIKNTGIKFTPGEIAGEKHKTRFTLPITIKRD